MGLVLTNTLSGRKEPLAPRVAGRVGVYWCGVTVYSRSHVGHARAFITVDVLCRYLRARGLPEKQAQALLIQAFVGEAIEIIVNDGLRELAISAAQRWLAARG